MKNKLIGIYGASGFGREVLPLIRNKLSSDDKVVFIDDGTKSKNINNCDVLSFDEYLSINDFEKHVTIAIANSEIREKIASKLHENNIGNLSVLADNVIIMDDVVILDGSILTPHVTLTSNIKIGKYFHANIYSYVAHDCVIGDYVTFAPSVKCNGNVYIEDHAYIGTGAIIKQGTPERPLVIGKGAVVGMGSVVTKSVKPGDVVFGNPAKSIKRGK
ncbi:NeuD/PglB/VioB family sugar acetyltransferase [Photobacterium damselae]|uniref:NeuD/PglB/VioB family sugar acetyltransferase n=1 Tax=Photobacterium damselae TaxID=38293 RepID=UPI000D839FEB|nr:NeuD/PglB/VioB family sugar acetyltransferase [Photobacterium damselae]NVO72615.1 NeuD/PglB/VioB family sugar acetyltransferase [Photobacterium damselae subsp. damselae]SPY22967.1 2,3,4,5-tetrahydropyridine-2,6-dicarboxylate N-acetyltransferase [Photobacterium damselae]